LAKLLKDYSKIIKSREKVWLDLNSCLIAITTFRECPVSKEDCAQSIPSINTTGVTLNRKSGSSFGPLRLPTPMEHFGIITMA